MCLPGVLTSSITGCVPTPSRVSFKITLLAMWTFWETEEGPSALIRFHHVYLGTTTVSCAGTVQEGVEGTCKAVSSSTPPLGCCPPSVPCPPPLTIFHLPLCFSFPPPPLSGLGRGRHSTLFMSDGLDLPLHLTALHTGFFLTLDP